MRDTMNKKSNKMKIKTIILPIKKKIIKVEATKIKSNLLKRMTSNQNKKKKSKRKNQLMNGV